MASPIIIDPIDDQSSVVGDSFQLDLDDHMTDADASEILTYSVVSETVPTGLTMDSATGLFTGTWSQAAADASPVTVVIRCTNTLGEFAEYSQLLTDISGDPNPEPPDYVVRTDGLGTHTTIQTAVNQMKADGPQGKIIEVQATTEGGTATFSENLNIDGMIAADGLECTIRARVGDIIRLQSATVASYVVQIRNSAYLIFKGFKRVGRNTWTTAVPWPAVASYPQQHGLLVSFNSHHIDIQDLGTLGSTTDAVFGGNNNTATLIGGFGSNGNPDGVHHVRVKNCHFYLHGNNNNTGGAVGDWGDLFIMRATNYIIEDCTFYRGGHNCLTIYEGNGIIRRCIGDNTWVALATGADGQRGAAIAGDQYFDSPNNILSEFNCFRWGLGANGSPNNPISKDQAAGGIFRFNYYAGGAGPGILASRNNGADGSVTESKWYHNVVLSANAVFRQIETATTFDDIYFEQSHVNEVYQQLGTGDAAVGANIYISKRDESTDLGGYPNGWKGDEWRGITVDTTALTFTIRLNDTSATTDKSITNAMTDWAANFSDWDEDEVTFTDDTLWSTSWDIDAIAAGLVPDSPPASVTDVMPLTLMDGAGVAATSGTLDDGRFFYLADTDADLSYFGEENDFMWIEATRVQIVTLNKTTGAVTFTPAATWADNAEVFADCLGSKVTMRGASQ